MKPLNVNEMHNLICGLQATAGFLRKAGKETVFLGDTEESVEKQRIVYFDRAAWCDAMAKTVQSKFKADIGVCYCGRDEKCSICRSLKP